jgi:hypothetical protein
LCRSPLQRHPFAGVFLEGLAMRIGQPKEFFAILEAMADEADAAFREV